MTDYANKTQNQRVLVFDTETTGLIKGPRPRALEQYPHITQITAILYSVPEQKIVAVLNEFVALPEGVHIDPYASQITGITDEICRERGRPIKDILQVLCELVLTCNVLVAHNYEFDSEVINAELHRCSERIPKYYVKMFQENYLQHNRISPFCTMKNSVEFCNLKTAYGRQKYPKLIELYRALFGLSPISGQMHNSAVDTWVCLRCFLKLYFKISISDEEFAEKMNLLIHGGETGSVTDIGNSYTAVSSRTRQRFHL